MANQLKVDMVNAIWKLNERGWSQRRIAKELGINRETVARYLNSQPPDSKPATNAPTGSQARIDHYKILKFHGKLQKSKHISPCRHFTRFVHWRVLTRP